MTRIMLYNHSGCENRGCEAIVRSTAAMFAQAGASVALTSRQPAYDRALHLHDVERIVPMTIAPYSVRRIINSVGFRMVWRARARLPGGSAVHCAGQEERRLSSCRRGYVLLG